MIAVHLNAAERALTAHVRHRYHTVPVRVKCRRKSYGLGEATCMSVARDGVITFFTASKVHGKYEFKAVGGIA